MNMCTLLVSTRKVVILPVEKKTSVHGLLGYMQVLHLDIPNQG